jgi:hypothetical protein
MKLFVTNFDNSTSIAKIAFLFCQYGNVTGIWVRDGQKRRYAIVEISESGGRRVIRELDGEMWKARG